MSRSATDPGGAYPAIPPTYTGEAGNALSDEREECGHDDPPCPRVNSLAEARFWIRVLNRRSVRDSEYYVEVLARLAAADAAILQLRRILAVLVLAALIGIAMVTL